MHPECILECCQNSVYKGMLGPNHLIANVKNNDIFEWISNLAQDLIKRSKVIRIFSHKDITLDSRKGTLNLTY